MSSAQASASLPSPLPRFSIGGPGGDGAGHVPRFLTVSIATELGILLALSVLFPFMIHILPVPDDARIGPRLLPMFYAPLLASLLGRKHSALIVAVIAPWLNWLLTSHPTPQSGVLITLELAVFVIVLRLLMSRIGARWFLALPAYVACMLAATVVAVFFPQLVRGAPALAWLVNTVKMGLPGIAVLILINWLAVRHYPTGSDGGGPKAA